VFGDFDIMGAILFPAKAMAMQPAPATGSTMHRTG
jgi:hypothetical protein